MTGWSKAVSACNIVGLIVVPATHILSGSRHAAHLAQRLEHAVFAQPHQNLTRILELLLMKFTHQLDVPIIELSEQLRTGTAGSRLPWVRATGQYEPGGSQRNRSREGSA